MLLLTDRPNLKKTHMKYSIPFWVTTLLLWLLGGSFLYFTFCCGIPAAAVNAAPLGILKKAAPALLIKDGLSFKAAAPTTFSYKPNGFNLEPVPTEVNQSFANLKAYLDKNSNKRLELTGRYFSKENYSGAMPNLGIARANSMKNWLITKAGFDASRFDLKSALLTDSLAYFENKLWGVVDFNFNEATTATNITAANFKPLTLYFNTNEAQLNLTSEQRAKVVQMIQYLDSDQKNKLEISGHTDSRGNRDSNIRLAQGRADFVQTYLIKNGIPANRLLTVSNGPDKPIDSNNTADGRAKNRRVEINLR